MTPASVIRWLDSFDLRQGGAAQKSAELIRMLLLHSPEPFSRNQYTPGHITATACVLHPTESAFLLILHKRLERWLMPGGHIEPEDQDVSKSASREAREETGIVLAPNPPILVSLDVHAIPPKKGEPLHLHHDFTFAFRAERDAVVVTEETEGVIWASARDVGKFNLAPNLRRAIVRALDLSKKR